MSHLWVPQNGGSHGVLELVRAEYALPIGAALSPPAAMLVRLVERDGWAVMARSARVRVNGVVIPGDLAVLSDKDEIRVEGADAPVWFSTEIVARIASAPAKDGRACLCPRCRTPIAVGSPAVCCPNCHVYHHEVPDRPCFSYQNAPCAACAHYFELGGAFRWLPEEL